MLGEPAPRPVELMRPPPALPAERCEPLPGVPVPPGQTPAPTAVGELVFLDWHGDDRLALQGYVTFTWSHDGEKLISASQDGVMFWNAATGVLERRIELPVRIESPVRVVLSPDGQWLAFVAYMLRKDPSQISESGFFLMRADGRGDVQIHKKTGLDIAFHSDGRHVGSFLKMWDIETGAVTTVLQNHFKHETKFLPGYERAVVFVPNDKLPKEAVIPELREVSTGKLIHRFPLLASSIGASLSGDGKRLGLLEKGELSVYSLETLERVAVISDIGKAQMVHLSEDGRRAVTEVLMCATFRDDDDMSWCPKPLLTVWDLDKKEKLFQTPEGSGSAWLFTPHGEYLTGPETRLVDYIIRVRDGQVVRFGSRIRSISPDGRRVLYDGKAGLEIGALDGKSPVPMIQPRLQVLLRSADGQMQVLVGADGRLRLERASNCLKLPIIMPGDGVRRMVYDYFLPGEDQVAFSPDGSSLFTLTWATSMHARFRAYDTRTGDERWAMQVHGPNGGNVQILPLSNQVVFQGNNHPELRRFRATTGEELPKGGMPREIYYTPPHRGGLTYEVRGHHGIRAARLYGAIAGQKNGTRLAMSGILDNKCVFSNWDLRNPRVVKDRYVGCLSGPKALSPDEKWVAAGTEQNRAMLLSLEHDETRVIDSMHEGKTTAIVFSPSGDRLAHADDLGNVVFADPWQGKIKGRARLPLDYAKRLWVSPDGQMLVVDTARGMQVRLKIVR